MAYAVGLATVSFYLRQLDVSISDPAALKARFIVTGTGMIGLAALVLGGALVGDRLARVRGFDWLIAEPDRGRALIGSTHDASRARDRRPKRHGWLVAGLGLPLAATIALYGLADAFAWDDLDLYTYALATDLAALLAGLAALLTVLAVAGGIKRDYPRWTLVTLLAAFTVVALYLYLSLVAVYLYPHIPPQFGGGRPKQERLVFKHDAAREANQLGIRLSAAEPLSQEVAVLFVGDGSRVVKVPGKGVVEVSDSLIVGAVPSE